MVANRSKLKRARGRALKAALFILALIGAGSLGHIIQFGSLFASTAHAAPVVARGTIPASHTPIKMTKMATVDWSKLPTSAVTGVKHSTHTAPRLDTLSAAQRAAYYQALKSGKLKAPTALAQPAPTGGIQSANAATSPEFDCGGYSNLPCAPYHFNGLNSTMANGFQDPDPTVAANGSYVMEGANGAFIVYGYNGAVVYGPTADTTFFAALFQNNSGLQEPQMYWDQTRQRWIIEETEFVAGSGNSNMSYYDIAVSKTTNPNVAPTDWYIYQIATNENIGGVANYCDAPSLGSDYWGVWLSCSAFAQSSNAFVGNAVFALDKSNLYNGTSANGFIYTQIPSGVGNALTLSPALEDGTPDAEFLVATAVCVGSSASNNVTTMAFTDTVALNSGVAPAASYVINTMPTSYACPVLANQPGNLSSAQPGIGTNQVQYKAGNLYFALTTAVNSGSDDGVWWAETEPQLTQLDQAHPANQKVANTIVRQNAIWAYASGTDAYLPTFIGSSEDDALLTFAYSSATIYPSLVYTGRRATDPLNTIGDQNGQSEVIISGSHEFASKFSSGTYSACSLAPNNTTRGTIFCVGEYGGATTGLGGWDTYVYGLRVE